MKQYLLLAVIFLSSDLVRNRGGAVERKLNEGPWPDVQVNKEGERKESIQLNDENDGMAIPASPSDAAIVQKGKSIVRRGTPDVPSAGLSKKTSPDKTNRTNGIPPVEGAVEGLFVNIMPRGDEGLGSRSLTLENEKTSKEKSAKISVQNNTEVVAQVGGTATLSCSTGHISDEVVTWLKRDDDQLLTIGRELYAQEARFSASFSQATKAWELFVRDVQLTDVGQYECQLTTHPPVTFLFSLKVTQAKAEIRGPREVLIEEGSQLDLQCVVKDSPNPPVYIFWYHNGTMVNYEIQRGLQVHLENFVSSLVVSEVRPTDAGIYTCDPHLATRASVVVHVVTGEKPAAMQHGRNPTNGSADPYGASVRCAVTTTLLILLLPTFIQIYFSIFTILPICYT